MTNPRMQGSAAVAAALKFVLCRIVCFVLVNLYLAKMNDSTAILARFVICTIVRIVLVELCFATMNDSITILARFVICRAVLCEL